MSVMGTDPSRFKGLNRPVENVSWDDSQEFCKRLTARLKGKVTVRLPWEAEWEYACRAGTMTEFHFGDVSNTDQVNYDGNEFWHGSPEGEYRQRTTDVGSFPANPWGLFDMHGNVWEWCKDWLGEYEEDVQTDPFQLGNEIDDSRVVRGGSWLFGPDSCRAASRAGHGPDYRRRDLGCRVCFRLE
jgi:formylglycine-generating enzyme required for sulfatase activity